MPRPHGSPLLGPKRRQEVGVCFGHSIDPLEPDELLKISPLMSTY